MTYQGDSLPTSPLAFVWLVRGGWGDQMKSLSENVIVSGAADDTLLCNWGRIGWVWGQRFVWTPATCTGPTTFLSMLYFWIWPFNLINQPQVEAIQFDLAGKLVGVGVWGGRGSGSKKAAFLRNFSYWNIKMVSKTNNWNYSGFEFHSRTRTSCYLPGMWTL